MKSSLEAREQGEKRTNSRISKGALLFVVAFLIFASAALYILINQVPKNFDDPTEELFFEITEAIEQTKSQEASLEEQQTDNNSYTLDMPLAQEGEVTQ